MSDTKALPEYPAQYVVHWPTGPVNACKEHADKLRNLGGFMGAHVTVTEAGPGASCSNCENEAKKRR